MGKDAEVWGGALTDREGCRGLGWSSHRWGRMQRLGVELIPLADFYNFSIK